MKKREIFLFLIIIFLLIGSIFYFVRLLYKKDAQKVEEPLTIILSPHFDDGVLSLGGLMAKSKHKLLVATFFTKKPAEIMHTEWDKISGFPDSDKAINARTKENENALNSLNAIIKNYDYPDFQYRTTNKDSEIRKEIANNIESLIADYPDKELSIYGPATFGPKITHPDHQIVHDALMDVWKKHKETNIHFYIYEDFPYINHFSKSGLDDLNTYLEKTENIKLTEKAIELNKTELSKKITGINTYKSQIKAFLSLGENLGVMSQKFYKERCKTSLPGAYACEVVHTAH